MRMMTSPLLSASPEYIEWLYKTFLQDPTSVDPQWRVAFSMVTEVGRIPASATDGQIEASLVRDGHLIANTNPLDERPRDYADEIANFLALLGNLPERLPDGPAAELRTKLGQSYLGTLAIETGHIDDVRARGWLVRRFKTVGEMRPAEERRSILEKLVLATEFERFLSVKYPSKKRFGCEGAEAVVPLLSKVIERASKNGVQQIVLGTMHRGRLNLIANVLGEPLVELLAKVKGARPYDAVEEIPADVPYHLGLETSLAFEDRAVGVSLLPNPSHLEAVNSVVLGRARALQDIAIASGRAANSVLPIVLHTDASVIGQGSVAEMIQLANPPGFTTHGTIHIIINNQIGFTTETGDARSSRYCTGAWKAVDSAILHLNGDDPDAVLDAAAIAADYRNEFRRDSVVDLICYRKNGHNEIDEPRFTQPELYRKIDAKIPVSKQYAARLSADGIVGENYFEETSNLYWNKLQSAYEASGSYRSNHHGYPGGRWAPFLANMQSPGEPDTGIDRETLDRVIGALAVVPDGFTTEPKIARQLRQRADVQKGIPWPLAEAIAFGSLLSEGISVRHSGQDIERGAFSHRHFAVVDQTNGNRFVNLRSVENATGVFDVVNSPLSEYSVLAFEYGYSLARPDMLTIWEAQFGDFANGAQIIIDQFLASGEDKWRQPSGLTVLLPHGLEGQGPEHSSARIERYLQIAARNNIQLANPTTPANYFHLLRRQIHRQVRKPLFVFSPKVLLRLPAAISLTDDFIGKTGFTPVLMTGLEATIRRVLLCSGKFYYEIDAERRKQGRDDIAIVRLEMLYPFPEAELLAVFARYPHARWVWVQEEPVNMGAWTYVDGRIRHLPSDKLDYEPKMACCSRPEAASPAGSFHGDHDRDQKRIIEQAFTV